jgi:hypothetical protein
MILPLLEGLLLSRYFGCKQVLLTRLARLLFTKNPRLLEESGDFGG